MMDHQPTDALVEELRDRVRWLSGASPDDFSYSGALVALQSTQADGARPKLARRAWAGRGLHVSLFTGFEYLLEPRRTLEGLPEPATGQFHHPLLLRAGPDGFYQSWTPSTLDQLAQDWYRF